MKVASGTIQAVASGMFAMSLFGWMTTGALAASDVQEKIIAAKQSRNLVVTMMNEAGKLTAGENHFCILFKSDPPHVASELHDVTVGFTLLVGRIAEAPVTTSLKQDGTGRYCGDVNLGRQYYRPANYRVFVRYIDAAGKKKSTDLSVAVK